MDRSASTKARSHTDMGEQFRAIAELEGNVAWIIDCTSGLPTYVSASVLALLGYDEADILAQFEAGNPNGPLAALCAGLAQRLQRFRAGDRSRLQVLRCFDQPHRDGRIIPIEVRSTILTDADGAPTFVAGILRDVSERRELFERQRRFTSMLNHEFRTPLSTIDGAIQRLEVTGAHADEPTRSRYRKIQVAVDRLIGMMDEHLSPERLAAAGATRPADTASPAELLEEAAALARLAGRGVDLELGPLPEQLRCQPNGLRLALKVLVENALQYSPAGKPVALAGRRVDDGVELLVRDAGKGVPVSECDTIFDKQYRGSNAIGAGSGLGLYMARSVIEVHGGSISVRNVEIGGAEFRIWLPMSATGIKSVATKVINSDNPA
ncbi:MAG: PAS domain-containing sensor histidine kinase [Pseudomonadota bacterium]